MDDVEIRPGREADLEALNELYNHYVRESPATFDLEPATMDARREWFGRYALEGPHRLLVVVRDGEVLGYGDSHPFRPRAAYATTVETTIYLAPGASGRGLGTRLYASLFEILDAEELRAAVAGITQPNPASNALHARMGFLPVGTFRAVGRKFGRFWDVAWFERPTGTLRDAPGPA